MLLDAWQEMPATACRDGRRVEIGKAGRNIDLGLLDDTIDAHEQEQNRGPLARGLGSASCQAASRRNFVTTTEGPAMPLGVFLSGAVIEAEVTSGPAPG